MGKSQYINARTNYFNRNTKLLYGPSNESDEDEDEISEEECEKDETEIEVIEYVVITEE